MWAAVPIPSLADISPTGNANTRTREHDARGGAVDRSAAREVSGGCAHTMENERLDNTQAANHCDPYQTIALAHDMRQR